MLHHGQNTLEYGLLIAAIAIVVLVIAAGNTNLIASLFTLVAHRVLTTGT